MDWHGVCQREVYNKQQTLTYMENDYDTRTI